nr:PREDICTED: E3 ubiquitin-protein ligase RNF126 [Lepisosteus oculatus]
MIFVPAGCPYSVCLGVCVCLAESWKMAEAPPRPGRFFCHRCSAEISPRIPEYTCPRCESGFIEELPEEQSTENGSTSTTSTSDENRHLFENADQHLFTFPPGYGQFALGIFDEGFEFGAGLPSEDNRESENRRERDLGSRQRYGARQPRARHLPRRQTGRHEGVPTLEGLNQFENTGPPPADREKIKTLPTVQITEEHVGSGLECPVCKEDYSVGENVRQLPCNHLFHNDCIVPWLEQHDTCPVCRKSLSGQNTATNPPGLSGMNFSSSSSSSSSSSPSNENTTNNS